MTFNKIINDQKHTDIIKLKDSRIEYNGCDFSNFFKHRKYIGKVTDNSVVDAPLSLKDKIDLDKTSPFHNNDKFTYNNSIHNRGSLVLVEVNKTSNLAKNDKLIHNRMPKSTKHYQIIFAFIRQPCKMIRITSASHLMITAIFTSNDKTLK